MAKTTFAYCAAIFLASVGLSGACSDTVAASDCKVMCQDVDNTCVQKCSDDTCKTACSTDLDNCVASCGTIMVTAPDGGH